MTFSLVNSMFETYNISKKEWEKVKRIFSQKDKKLKLLELDNSNLITKNETLKNKIFELEKENVLLNEKNKKLENVIKTERRTMDLVLNKLKSSLFKLELHGLASDSKKIYAKDLNILA